MKASELRIGNYYSFYGAPKQATSDFIERLDAIQQAGKIAVDASPFPLTAEWLEEFGLRPIDVMRVIYAIALESEDRACPWQFEICRHEDNTFWFESLLGMDDVQIKYVHQLQNLYFALTVEELVVKQPAQSPSE